MVALVWVILATGLVSLFAFGGIFTLSLKKELFEKILLTLVAFSAGTLMGTTFLHLLPQALEESKSLDVFRVTLIGFAFYLFLEKAFWWHHCHDPDCDQKPFAILNLLGEVSHNFIDGLIIAASFLISVPLGLTTSLVVAFHEIPQEIGDYSILVYAGYSRSKALVLNFAVALTGVVGGLVGLILSGRVEGLVEFLIPFTAGCFLYLAATDLVPEIKKEHQTKSSAATLIVFCLGLLLMYSLTYVSGG